MSDSYPVNSANHEKVLSESAKGMVGGLLDLCATALNKAIDTVGSEDPLSAERYIHLADRMSDIAVRMYSLGESSRIRAAALYKEEK